MFRYLYWIFQNILNPSQLYAMMNDIFLTKSQGKIKNDYNN